MLFLRINWRFNYQCCYMSTETATRIAMPCQWLILTTINCMRKTRRKDRLNPGKQQHILPKSVWESISYIALFFRFGMTRVPQRQWKRISYHLISRNIKTPVAWTLSSTNADCWWNLSLWRPMMSCVGSWKRKKNSTWRYKVHLTEWS